MNLKHISNILYEIVQCLNYRTVHYHQCHHLVSITVDGAHDGAITSYISGFIVKAMMKF